MEVPLRGDGVDLFLGKALALGVSEERIEVRYRLRNGGERAAWGRFATEWNLNFLSGSGPDRRYEGIGERNEELSSRGVTEALRGFKIVDKARGIAVEMKADRDFTLLRYPVETASLSESGVEKIHQGICLRLLFPVRLEPGESVEYSLYLSVFSVASP